MDWTGDTFMSTLVAGRDQKLYIFLKRTNKNLCKAFTASI